MDNIPAELIKHGGMELKRRIQKLILSDPRSDLAREYDFPVPLRCRKTSDTVFVVFARSTVGACPALFSSRSTDFSQQIAQAVLFLFLVRPCVLM